MIGAKRPTPVMAAALDPTGVTMQARRTSIFGLRARLALAVIASCAFAATGSAATRYAGVGGTNGPDCPIGTPCTIAIALSGAATGDTVHVLPGTHATTSTVFTQTTAANVIIEGEGIGASVLSYAPAMPTTNPAILLQGATPTVRNLTVVGAANTSRLITGVGVNTGPVFDRVVLRNDGSGEALIVSGGATVRDSIITIAGAVPAVRLDGTMTGSTVVAASGPAVEINGDFAPGFSATGIIRNSILSGGSSDIAVIDQVSVIMSRLDLDYSAYRQNGIVTQGPVTQTIGTHNVFTAPLLVNITDATDVHQLAASPTIDAGDPAAAAGSTGDMDGQSRIIGSAPDIGADEALTKPAVAMSGASNVTTTGATLNGTVNPAGLETTYHFQYGPTGAYGSASPDVVVPAGFATAVAAFDVSGLAIGGTFHARLVATNSAGTATSADQTITLNSPPAPVDDPAPVVGKLTLVPASPKTGRTVTVRFSLSEQARVTVTIERLLPGRKKGTACKVGATSGVRCTKIVRRATLTRTVAAGAASTFAIPAKPGGSKLVPGRYRVRVTARDLVTGKQSVMRTAVLVVRA